MAKQKLSRLLLDDATVRHVAHLARIAISEQEASLYSEQLSKILEYVGLLNEVNTDAVDPTEHPLEATDVMRSDIPVAPVATESALRNAPDKQGECFRVPRVLEQNDA